MKRRIHVCLAALLVLPAAAAAQTQVIATESFDYLLGPIGNQQGGTGWLNPWWSGANGDHGLVTSPGFDATGEKLTSHIQFGGSYRKPDPVGHDDVTLNGKFGKDGASFWFRFQCQRSPGSLDAFGGFSLFEQFAAGEVLFVGSPWMTNEWGIDTIQIGTFTVPGTDPGVLATLVTRLDFLPGQERVRLWIDPQDDHPTTPADVDTMLDDFQWDEVRFDSGLGLPAVGYDFDGLVIERVVQGQSLGISYCGPPIPNSTGFSGMLTAFGSDVVADNFFQLTSSFLPQNQFGYVLAGQTQGFVVQPGGSQGNLCLSGNIGRFNSQIQTSGSTGEFTLDVDLTNIPVNPPAAVMAGETWNFQSWYRDVNPQPTSNFTDGLQVTFL